MTGTWVETSATSRRLEASTSTTSGTGRPEPAAPVGRSPVVGLAPLVEPVGLVAGARLDRSTAPNMLMAALPSSGRSPFASLVWVFSVLAHRRGWRASRCSQARARRRPGSERSRSRAGGSDVQDGLAEADAVGAGVLESSRSTFISAVSAPRTVTFPPLPSLGMEKATMES